jgi:hypothetical protein
MKKKGFRRVLAFLVVFIILFLIFLEIAKALPPEERIIRGIVYKNGGAQAPVGIDILINDTNSSVVKTTKTYGPPSLTGAYSTTINSSLGDRIYVRAWNGTVWGYNTGSMGETYATINVTLNRTRNSEARVIILLPQNHSVYTTSSLFNVTANITILGNNGVNCNATIYFSVPEIIQLSLGESSTHNLGSISWNNSISTAWNLTGGADGSTNISVDAKCGSDGTNLEGLNFFTIYNITSTDITPPAVRVFSPLNNTGINNPVIFYYNVSDASLISNCSLFINGLIVNTTVSPVKNSLLNFTNILTQKTNSWEINCTDLSSMKNLGTSGVFNLSLNDIPSIIAIQIDTPVNLIAGSNKTIYCNGTARDGDTYFDISRINATLFHSTRQPGSQNNNSNHYTNASCSTFNGAENIVDFSCAFIVEYYANNGTWFCNATVVDIINSTNSSQQEGYINDLLAIGLSPNIIDFGSLEIMQISPFDIPITVTNYGNIMLDLRLYAYASFENDNLSMECTKGNISLDY